MKYCYHGESDTFEIFGEEGFHAFFDDKVNQLLWSLPCRYWENRTTKAFSSSKNTLKVIPTNNCNLSCTYCYSQGTRSIDGDVETILASFKKQLTISTEKVAFIGGGEPTLNDILIKEIVSYCKEINPNISFTIQTNGLFSTMVRSFLIENDFEVIFSLDGPYSHVKAVQQSGYTIDKHHVIESNVRAIVSNQEKHAVNCVLSPDVGLPKDEIAFLSYYTNLGVKKLILNVEFEYFLKQHTIDELKNLAHFFFRILQIKPSLPSLMLVTPIIKADNFRQYCSGKYCSSFSASGRPKRTIFPDGSVGYCHRRQDLKWNDKDSSSLFEHPNRPFSDCQSCIARQICQLHTCPVNTLLATSQYCQNLQSFRMVFLDYSLSDIIPTFTTKGC